MNVWTFLGFEEPVRKAKKTVQLVKHWDDVNDKNKKFPYIVQTKLDGVYAMLIVKYDGQRKIFSRTGNEFTNTEHLTRLLQLIGPGVYIGEMVNDKCSLEILSGIHNTNRTKALDYDQERLKRYSNIMFHDCLTLGEFIAGISLKHYTGRCQRLHDADIIPGNRCMSHLINDQFQLDYIFELALKGKQEGIVIKRDCDWDANHKGWRMMKLVKGISLDLKALGVWGGTKGTKREGMVNKISIRYNGQTIKADLGKGWTDKMRIELLKDPSIIVDKIVEVTAFGKSSKGKLRQPKVGHVRIDKDEPDK